VNIPLSGRYQKSEGLEVNQVPDGYVIYQADRDRVHFLNTTAAAVLELCDGDHTVDDIVAILAAAYELPERPEESVLSSVSNLVDEGLLAPCAP
jgi:hypothetical protein